ncbi:hypothetical protein EHS13_09035 [Paenibacillus psychroresistens]|uniref:Uncharacterized protein n=1 Tax=Paenibacillus psychroresistens TaxID=1778678 RepID=A0A6B8RFY4_9BACL|nr:hypothetical protein [Paenibacillus psychroresistens]QGQ95019.1 hypothetical protein EHS13_09035 [Paenibacillus psychroresistens]
MLKISKLFKVAIGIFSIILIGAALLFECNKLMEINKNASSIIAIEQEINQLQENETIKTDELSASKVMIDSLKKSVSEMQNQINATNRSNSEDFENKRVDNEKVEHLLIKLPQVSKKMAIIKNVVEKDGSTYSILDYVEMLGGEAAARSYMEDTQATQAEADAFVDSFTNGYYIRNKKVEQDMVQIENDALIYGVYGDAGPKLKYMNDSDFILYNQNNKDSLFWFYFIDNKIVYMTEQYRP